jgi:hypothetical protein
MPELDEGEVPKKEPSESKTVSSIKGNPLQKFLSRKIKIGGKEIPLPLIVLGIVGLGVIAFTLLNKGKSGGRSATASPGESASLGESEGLGGRTFASQGQSTDEMQADLGNAFTPTPIEPLPNVPMGASYTPHPVPDIGYASLPDIPQSSYGGGFSPLPVPELPYADFGAQSYPEIPANVSYPEPVPGRAPKPNRFDDFNPVKARKNYPLPERAPGRNPKPTRAPVPAKPGTIIDRLKGAYRPMPAPVPRPIPSKILPRPSGSPRIGLPYIPKPAPRPVVKPTPLPYWPGQKITPKPAPRPVVRPKPVVSPKPLPYWPGQQRPKPAPRIPSSGNKKGR